MSDSTKKVLLMIAAVIVGIWAIKIVFALILALVGQVLALAIPAVIIGGVIYGLYHVFGRKALGGGRKTLP